MMKFTILTESSMQKCILGLLLLYGAFWLSLVNFFLFFAMFATCMINYFPLWQNCEWQKLVQLCVFKTLIEALHIILFLQYCTTRLALEWSNVYYEKARQVSNRWSICVTVNSDESKRRESVFVVESDNGFWRQDVIIQIRRIFIQWTTMGGFKNGKSVVIDWKHSWHAGRWHVQSSVFWIWQPQLHYHPSLFS